MFGQAATEFCPLRTDEGDHSIQVRRRDSHPPDRQRKEERIAHTITTKDRLHDGARQKIDGGSHSQSRKALFTDSPRFPFVNERDYAAGLSVRDGGGLTVIQCVRCRPNDQ